MPTPDREVDVSVDVARQLLIDQHPDLQDEPLIVAGEGWDNVTIRIGADLAMRLPRRALAADLLRHEQQWLPEIQKRSIVALPVPIRVGDPTTYYPYSWSIVPWFVGSSASRVPLNAEAGTQLGAFLRTLHGRPPADAPRNPCRSQPLTSYSEPTERRLELVDTRGLDLGVDIAVIRSMWRTLSVTRVDTADTWIHGDLHANNILSREGVLVSVIDWGDMAAGDAAVDLSCAWSLFDEPDRDRFWSSYGTVSQETMNRSQAWAIVFSLLWILDASDVEPTFAAMGRQTLVRLGLS